MKKTIQLDDIAKRAIEMYDLDVREITFLLEETNIFYKVLDHAGQQYALKIFQTESSTLEDNKAEIFFMNIIRKSQHVSLPNVYIGKNGDEIQLVETIDSDIPKRVALYSWIEGEDLDGNENEARYEQFGELTALLHQATIDVNIPPEIKPKKWDEVFYYRHEKPVYKETIYQRFLDDDYHNVMDKIIPFLNKKLANYYEDHLKNVRLIHGDLNPWNVKVENEKMHILDFEDALLGLPIHDFATMLYYYQDQDDYANIKKCFFNGYQKISQLPVFTDYDIDLLITARRVNYLNYVLLVDDDPQKFIEENMKKVHLFLNKYQITL
ncbi:phosphotransferase [Hazenella sp. IB182357]|uniref:Phosphotransferase n=1 Tax=Polycladospora coralii TaxID=2771432 RepID=A0A926NBZ5_9BACL|nr:phosphotransferase [Polycladospora coralii]MBD1373808.1 phosphotransferase [Polycladospora coralii]MBS7531989.1 phosphotransferase [Polycladospora coralii]